MITCICHHNTPPVLCLVQQTHDKCRKCGAHARRAGGTGNSPVACDGLVRRAADYLETFGETVAPGRTGVLIAGPDFSPAGIGQESVSPSSAFFCEQMNRNFRVISKWGCGKMKNASLCKNTPYSRPFFFKEQI